VSGGRCELGISVPSWLGPNGGLTEIAGLDNDGRIWAIDCNLLKITIQRFYQLTGTYNRASGLRRNGLDRCIFCNNIGQVVHTHVPLSPSSIIWYRSRGGDALRLGR